MDDQTHLLKNLEIIAQITTTVFTTLIQWYIFFCTLNATSFITGYLVNIKYPVEEPTQRGIYINRLVLLGCRILLVSSILALLAISIAFWFFYNQDESLDKLLALVVGNIPEKSFQRPFPKNTFCFLCVAMLASIIALVFFWITSINKIILKLKIARAVLSEDSTAGSE